MADAHNGSGSDLIVYNAVHRVAICTACGYALRNIKEHLVREHLSLPLPNRRCIVEQHSQHDLVAPQELVNPQADGHPILGLCDPVKAYQCLSDQCTWLSINEDGMQQHIRERHRQSYRRSQGSHLWKSVWVQTFFTNRFVKWFTVRPEEAAATTSSVDNLENSQQTQQAQHSQQTPHSQQSQHHCTRLTNQAAVVLAEFDAARDQRTAELEQVDDEVLKQDRTGWFNRTGWPEHLSGRNLQHLAHASRLPDRDDVLLKEAVRVVNLTVGQAVMGLSTLDLELRRWIRSAKQTEIDVRPFARLQNPESQDTYTGYWRRFFCYTIRVCQALEQWTQEEEGEEASEDEEDSEEDEEEEDEAAEDG